MIQTVAAKVHSPRSRLGVSVCEFDAVYGVDGGGRRGTGGGGCAQLGVDVRHIQGTGQRPAFLCNGLLALQEKHARWGSGLRDAECEASLAGVADAWRCEASGGGARDEEAGVADHDWSGFLASDPAVQEVKEALKLIDAGVRRRL